MGIKRTPTGRIYYDKGEDRHAQMTGLLEQLGDRLKRSEQEREELWKEIQEYRKIVADVEDKATKSEKIYLSVQSKLSQNEKLGSEILKRQENLEKEQQEQAQKLGDSSKSDGDTIRRLEENENLVAYLTEKLEESENQQKRLDRRIEKISQDRSRLTRKIERLEETVMETQEVLRARALVLLTDQSIAAQTSLPRISGSVEDEDIETARLERAEKDIRPPWWRQYLQPQTVSTTFLMVLALLLGWSISQWQYSSMHAVAVLEDGRIVNLESGTEPENITATEAKTAKAEQTPDEEISAAYNEIKPVPAPDKNTARDELLSPVTKETDITEVLPLDTGNYDEQALLEQMEKDPETLAARLNAIEPATPGEAGIIMDNVKDKPAGQGKIREASIPPEDKKVEKPEKVEANLRGMVKPDPRLPDSLKKLEKEAFAGEASAQHDLASVYTAGYGDVKQDYSKAAFWFEQSAKQGIANSGYNLGVLYHQGLGVDQNTEKAIDWYKKAAELDHPEAQYNLGIAYIEGIGVKYDPNMAAYYFERAASQKIMEAAYNLGLIHENGLLGKASPEEALLWYKTAADWGSSEARQAMEQLARSLNIKPEEIDRMVNLAKAEQNGNLQRREDEAINNENSMPPLKSIDETVVTQIQNQLIELGLYPGPADGNYGPITADAIRSYQKANNLEVTGEPSENLMIHMLASGIKSVSGNEDTSPEGEVGSREE